MEPYEILFQPYEISDAQFRELIDADLNRERRRVRPTSLPC